MSQAKRTSIKVKGAAVAVVLHNRQDYICLTDIAKHKEPDRADHVIQNWMRNRNTVEFLGIWEGLHNPDFKPLGFEGFKSRAGLNSFVLTPPAVTKAQSVIVYAEEADLLNVALFGRTARQWREVHPDAEGNIRDQATIEQLVVLTNLESLNAVFIRQGLPPAERLLRLNEIAISQMRTLLSAPNVKRLK